MFFPAVASGYWLLVRLGKLQAALNWVLAGCIGFYLLASPHSLLVLLPSITFDYVVARIFLVLPDDRRRARTLLIAIGILENVGVLSYFKYRNFFVDIAGSMLGMHWSIESVVLPLGISFLTFQKIAFLCDVSAGKIKQINSRDFLLFALFFPKAIAGPIVHYQEVMPQFAALNRQSCWGELAIGFCLFSIGLFKKCVVADGVAQFVSLAFYTGGSETPVAMLPAWIGALAYTFQLYFDFSGYSDMALGASRMLGVRLPMNFNSPLKATSMVDYWGRWHITLTRFLTWYIYIPLVRHLTRFRAARGKALLRGKNSTPSAILVLVGVPTGVTMLVSGVWHGVGIPFVVWGLIHGVYLMVNQAWRLLRPRFFKNQDAYDRFMRPIGFVLTFVCVVSALVVFRASSLHQAVSVLSGMIGLHGIASWEFQLLHRAGFDMVSFVVWDSLSPVLWLSVLFAGVILLPNSLELLRRFEPSLDFPEKGAAEVSNGDPTADNETGARRRFDLIQRVVWGILHLKDIGRVGVPLNGLTAVVSAALFVAGATAIGRGAEFLYGGF